MNDADDLAETNVDQVNFQADECAGSLMGPVSCLSPHRSCQPFCSVIVQFSTALSYFVQLVPLLAICWNECLVCVLKCLLFIKFSLQKWFGSNVLPAEKVLFTLISCGTTAPPVESLFVILQ